MPLEIRHNRAEHAHENYQFRRIVKTLKLVFEEKGCPKNTFLSLCEEGLVKGIPKSNYTKSVKNKDYALRAVAILEQNKHTTFLPKELWDKLELGDKRSNSQMDVVLALWENGLIEK
jgi:hypothetical protein